MFQKTVIHNSDMLSRVKRIKDSTVISPFSVHLLSRDGLEIRHVSSTMPTWMKVTATKVAMEFMREIVRLYGMPWWIVSDWDLKFFSKFWQELHRIIGIKSAACHPQTDGSLEWANRTVAQILWAIIDSDQSNWALKLPPVKFAINSTISSTLKLSPFKVNYGWSPTMINLPGKQGARFPGVHKFVELA